MNVLFVFAHPDDEAFGPAGTIARHRALGDTVTVLSLCRGNRPGAVVEDARQAAFHKSCAILGASGIIKDNDDTVLEYHTAIAQIRQVVADIGPSIVYTHNISDLHRDHRIVAEACLVVCRPMPESTVDQLLYCEIAASTDWAFSQLGAEFTPNVFVDVEPYMVKKRQVLDLYTTEVHDFPDARSTKAMEVHAMNVGRRIGVEYAEAFKLVFSRARKI